MTYKEISISYLRDNLYKVPRWLRSEKGLETVFIPRLVREDVFMLFDFSKEPEGKEAARYLAQNPIRQLGDEYDYSAR